REPDAAAGARCPPPAPAGREALLPLHDRARGRPPGGQGTRDGAAAWRLKTLCALRSYCLWLHKGIDVLHYFSAYEGRALGMGLLPPVLKELAAGAEFDAVATPPMKAVRNLTRAFAGSTPLREVRALHVDVSPLGKPGRVFEG